jgi:hypothetical protein
MNKAKNAITLLTSLLGLASLGVTIAGQYRRHRDHAEHSQHCPCLTGCMNCACEAARGR